MKNSLSIALFGGVVALASCASGPTPEEQAAAEQARLDSLKAVEQFRLDSMAQVAAEAEAAAYAAGQAAAEKTTTTTTSTTTSTTTPAKTEEPVKTRPGATSTGEKDPSTRPGAVSTGAEKTDAKKSRPGAVKTE